MTTSADGIRPAGAPALVVQTGFLGDTVLTTPLLERLAVHGPVDVIVRADASPLLNGHPAVRDVIPYDKRGSERGVAGVRRLVRRVRQRATGEPRETAVAYLVHGSVRSALLPWLAGVPVRVGWEGAWPARALLTHRVPFPTRGHHVQRLLALLGASPADASHGLRPSLHPSAEEHHLVERALLAHGPRRRDARPLVVLAPGSVWGTKRWPHYPQLARHLRDRYRLVVVGGAGDGRLGAAIRQQAPEALDLTGSLSLLATTALVARADAVVSNDSLVVHLASGTNTPTVALFGPTAPAFGFGPLAEHQAIVQLETLPCRPCHHHGPQRCPLGHHQCMTDLPMRRVLAALDGVLPPREPSA
jgi:heptosyltransferase-2